MPGALRLRLPATSANLGPGFDALGLAMGLYLTIEAETAAEFEIKASGRSPELCGSLERNLILTTYREVVEKAGRTPVPLRLVLRNEIPLGMGCGSSAAALLAGVALASHFGGLDLSSDELLVEACRREGHPDNVAACWKGFLTCSLMTGSDVLTATSGSNLTWKILLALPATSLSTETARSLLPESYSRNDAVANIQRTALLVAAFATARPELLRDAMADSIHQPYRMEACPLLPRLLPLNAEPGVLGVALSGAGPAVLFLLDEWAEEGLKELIRWAAAEPGLELIETTIVAGAEQEWLTEAI